VPEGPGIKPGMNTAGPGKSVAPIIRPGPESFAVSLFLIINSARSSAVRSDY